MKLNEYFSDKDGLGIFSSANKNGEVNSAVYAKPHILDNGNVAFIMRDRLTHSNVTENPHASFLFIEHDKGFHGIRLKLEMVDEITDPEIIAMLSRRSKTEPDEKRFLASFKIVKAMQLIGGEEIDLE
jgi:hypothetical protein